MFSVSKLNFWLTEKTETKQVVNGILKWVEGVAVEKAMNPGRRF